MVQKYLSKRCSRFYCIFVDFHKAFEKLIHMTLHCICRMESTVNVCLFSNHFIQIITILYLFLDELSLLLRWNCGSGIGIHGQCMPILKSLYTNLRSCVKLNNGITDFFSCNIGTRHGDKTSSTIFYLFIDELSLFLRWNCGSGIFITNDIPYNICLMLADDVAGCAEIAIKLQQQSAPKCFRL